MSSSSWNTTDHHRKLNYNDLRSYLAPLCSGGRRKISLPVYTEDESNDLSDLGIGTSSASGKSSMSEDFDNHSVIVSILHLKFTALVID